MEKSEKNKHFVLVHGFGHGAWCWFKLVSLLKLSGHRATALDLGGCGLHPKQLHEVSSISDYSQPLIDFLADLPDDEKVILVAHSYGGIPISLAMENFPGKISVAIFVSAYMPDCGNPPGTLVQEFFSRCPPDALMDSDIAFDGKLPISAMLGQEFMAAKVYKHCPSEDLELGKMLVRPNSFFVADISKEGLLSEERYGSVKRCYVVLEDDEVMVEEFQRYNIEKSPPDDVITISGTGAGHMVMLTKPQELCSRLLQLAQKF